MKKLLLIAIVALVGVSASAQVKFNRTFASKKSNTTWYLRAGMNTNSSGLDLSEYNGDYYEYNVSSKVGYEVAFGFNKGFGKSNVYWGMELGVSSRGFSISEEEDGDVYGDYSYMGHNVKFVPFMIGYKYPITEDFKIDGHLGAFASFDFASTEDYDNGPDDYDIWDESPFDAGIQIGIGAWYKRLNLDFTYQIGFVPSHSVYYIGSGDEDLSAKHSAFLIRLGVAF